VVVAAAVGAGAAFALNRGGSGSPPPSASNSASNLANANLPGSVQAFDDPSSTIPAGWTQEIVKPSATGTPAGFSIAVPPGWTEKRSGQVTYFYAPGGGWLMKIDLTAHTYPNMLTEAKYIESQVVAKGKFPQYKRVSLRAVPIRGTNGAFWQFTWVNSGSVQTRSDDILFVKPTSAGSQSYAIYFRAPTPGNDWNTKYLPVFKKMLRTFQSVPS
jgi:eukaryotic-like serine/threonine-protein kinase